MPLKLIYCFLLVYVPLSVFSLANDTLNQYKLKGIDVNFGIMGYDYGLRTSVNFADAVTPSELNRDLTYNEAFTNKRDVFPVKIGLNFVFSNNQRNFKYFIHKHEVLFRFAFETIQDNAEINNIKHQINSYLNRDISMGYTYQTQSIGLGYQLASKPFLKNFALFMGIHADFGMLTLKQLDVPYYNYINVNPNNIKFENYYSTFFRGTANLGIKYNFSCDINFFFQTEFAFLRYGKDIETNALGAGASFGIRYKFLEDQDKLRYNKSGFW